MDKNLVAIDGTLDAVGGIQVHVVEKGRAARGEDIHISRRDAVREHIACSNPLCQGGGFSLGDLLRELVRSRQTEFIGASFCTGQEDQSPGNLKETRSCQTRFDVHARLRYRRA